MGFKKNLQETAYRLKVRKALSNESNEILKITYEECRRMCEKRKIKL